jgi:hypothetical protein
VEELKPSRKRFEDYDITPLKVEISEVLMVVKRDPEFVQPPKILGNPP